MNAYTLEQYEKKKSNDFHEWLNSQSLKTLKKEYLKLFMKNFKSNRIDWLNK